MRGRPIEVIADGLSSQMGTAFDTSPTTVVGQKVHASARCLASAWEQNRKLANQADPLRVTDFLSRWEAIFGIRPPYGATDSQRRNALAARWGMIGKRCDVTSVHDLLHTMLPNTFVGVVHTASPYAAAVVPVTVIGGTGGAPPGTNTIAGADPSAISEPGYWSGSCHHLAIQVAQPAWMSDADFYTEVGAVYNGTLRRFLPAWVTFSWFRDGHAVPGFYLDDPHNLDNERVLDVLWGATPIGGAAFTQSILPVYFSATASPPTYCNYYGFNVPTPENVTITVTRGTAPSARFLVGPGTDPTAVLPSLTYTGLVTATFSGVLAAGNYVIEASANATSTIGTSPGTLTVQITSP